MMPMMFTRMRNVNRRVTPKNFVVKNQTRNYQCKLGEPLEVHPFFEEVTNTAQYVIFDKTTHSAAIIDPVLDLEFHSGKLTTTSADKLLSFVESSKLNVKWILETHVHADHLTSSSYLQKILSKQQKDKPLVAISKEVVTVQKTLSSVLGFNLSTDGSQFDRLLSHEEKLNLGDLEIEVLHVPGHTPADCAFLVRDDALFVGDTLCMPDSGTARCDFPGGSADSMWKSAHFLLSLSPSTRVFVCHDYKANNSRPDYKWETSIGEEIKANIHVKQGTTKEDFLKFRENRDKVLGLPRLFYPSLEFNLQAGKPVLENGKFYVKIPTNFDTFNIA